MNEFIKSEAIKEIEIELCRAIINIVDGRTAKSLSIFERLRYN